MTRALIMGITGQDGSYLADFLLTKGYEVHGMLRRSSAPNTSRIDHLNGKITLHIGDMADAQSLACVLAAAQPGEIYNLAAQSDVPSSFRAPAHTLDIVAGGALRLFELVRHTRCKIKIYQASSSEMFGASEPPQNEQTPFLPQNPYAVAKVAAHHYARLHREAYGLHISCGICFNHESPRRSEEFVTRKITRAVGRIKHGLQEKLYLGNLNAYRDWGYAGDYVEAMWRMVQQKEPGDYVIATGKMNQVRDFAETAFACAELNWAAHVVIDERLKRPVGFNMLLGDAAKARRCLGWEPRVSFRELIEMMVKADMELARREKESTDAI